MTRDRSYLLLLICCVLSRLGTTIFYIEDIDSLRFALSIGEYSIIKLQPHFPGYPVFCFLAKAIFFFTNSGGITFSIIGGLSVFTIIYFIIQFNGIRINTNSGLFCTLIIFFNPFIWLMSNRYMPDLMGVAISLSAMYYLTINTKKEYSSAVGFILIGILAGVRLSYLPLLIIPFFYNIIQSKERLHLLLSFSFGCSLWLIPLVWITGINDLILVATKQTLGHFSDFGGTVLTESNWQVRLLNFIRSVWADGLGGYWGERSWQTLFLSFPLTYILYLGTTSSFKAMKNNVNFRILIYSLAVYIIWILFFQNIIHKSRHILPVLVIILSIMVSGQNALSFKNTKYFYFLNGLFFIFLVSITLNLVFQHTEPTAISQLKDRISDSPQNKRIISIPLINYYLRTHGIDADYISIEDSDLISQINLDSSKEVLVVGNYRKLFQDNYQIIPETVLFHNPYVNRMWSEIPIYRLAAK